MILVFLGPPGSGKGTQAKLLSEKLHIPHISMGDILREEIRMQSAIGIKIKKIMNSGKLVPDEISIALFMNRIAEADCRAGFIMDGFPRSLVQAEAFDNTLKKTGRNLDKVIYFKVSEDQIVDRLSGRRSCKNCGAVYHIKYNPSKIEGTCDACGGELFQRPDDEEKAIRTRFEVYAESTRPLIERYKEADKLAIVDASGSIENIFADLVAAIQSERN